MLPTSDLGLRQIIGIMIGDYHNVMLNNLVFVCDTLQSVRLSIVSIWSREFDTHPQCVVYKVVIQFGDWVFCDITHDCDIILYLPNIKELKNNLIIIIIKTEKYFFYSGLFFIDLSYPSVLIGSRIWCFYDIVSKPRKDSQKCTAPLLILNKREINWEAEKE